MRRVLVLATAAAFAVVLARPMLAADEKTVKGEVIDVACNAKKASNPDSKHDASCAMKCAQKGAALGILASDGIYKIEGDMTKDSNKQLLDYVAKKVEVKGAVTET